MARPARPSGAGAETGRDREGEEGETRPGPPRRVAPVAEALAALLLLVVRVRPVAVARALPVHLEAAAAHHPPQLALENWENTGNFGTEPGGDVCVFNFEAGF